MSGLKRAFDPARPLELRAPSLPIHWRSAAFSLTPLSGREPDSGELPGARIARPEGFTIRIFQRGRLVACLGRRCRARAVTRSSVNGSAMPKIRLPHNFTPRRTLYVYQEPFPRRVGRR